MGLTISYQLRLIAPSIDPIYEKVLALHRIAKNLGFMEVGEIGVAELKYERPSPPTPLPRERGDRILVPSPLGRGLG